MTLQATQHVKLADGPTQAWDRLADQVDALIHAWEHETAPPDLTRFVPAEPAHLRGMIVTELIKVDLEIRWNGRRAPKLVEDYVDQFPELAVGGELPCDLIYEEYHVRRQSGDTPTVDDYYRRFPRQVAQLKRLLGLEEPNMTTTIVGRSARHQELEPGAQLDDFDLLIQLGKGAFAQVFLARQRSMQRIVALKVSSDKGVEGITLSQLDHPHVVRVYDQRVIKERKLRLMYMQNIPGGTLQSVVDRVRQIPASERTGKLLLDTIDQSLETQGVSPPSDSALRRRLANAPWPEVVCWLGARMASGLDHAHQHGVLHRDIKPANVLLAADGSPKLADFNVSFSSKLEGATPAAYFGGSLAYMSPEQMEAADADHEREVESLDGRSDLYSLGIVLWELLVGERPFQDQVIPGNWNATLRQLTARRRAGIPAEAIAKLPANLPRGMENVLLQVLSPDADQRPSTAGALGKQLDLCLQPKVQRLLQPTSGTYVDFLKQHPLIVMIVCALAANGILSYFNTSYNWIQIIRRVPEVWEHFWCTQVPWVNGVCYTIGLTVGIAIALPVIRVVRIAQDKGEMPAKQLPIFRDQSTRIGERVTWLTIVLWVISGVAFPTWLLIYIGTNSPLRWTHFAHFMASQLVCGIIASTQAFFTCTAYSMRYVYPRFVRPEAPADPVDLQRLSVLLRRSGFYYYLAVAAPLIALMLFISIPEATPTAAVDAPAPSSWLVYMFDFWTTRSLMFVLAALGLLGTFLSMRMHNSIQADIAALATALDPNRESSAGTDSFSSSLSMSR